MSPFGASQHGARLERIINLATQYLDVGWDCLRARRRDQQTVEARQLFCYLLSHAGYSVTVIARLLERNHSTVAYAISKVEHSSMLAEEAQRLAGAVIPFLYAENEHLALRTVPVQAVSRSLLRSLLGAASLRDVRAVRAYVCGTLLGRERVSASQAAWGLCIVSASPRVRSAVEEVLERCGLSAYRGLIDLQLRQSGIR